MRCRRWQRRAIDALIAANELATQRTPNHRLSRTLLTPIHERFGGQLRMIFAGGAFVEPRARRVLLSPRLSGRDRLRPDRGLHGAHGQRPASRFARRPSGRPVAGVELELRERDDDGVGEVYARGRTIMRGYLDAPELTREAFVDGWLRTGDLGTIDASGHLQPARARQEHDRHRGRQERLPRGRRVRVRSASTAKSSACSPRVICGRAPS